MTCGGCGRLLDAVELDPAFFVVVEYEDGDETFCSRECADAFFEECDDADDFWDPIASDRD